MASRTMFDLFEAQAMGELDKDASGENPRATLTRSPCDRRHRSAILGAPEN